MGHDPRFPPRQPIPVWAAQALLAMVQGPRLYAQREGLCLIPPPAGRPFGNGWAACWRPETAVLDPVRLPILPLLPLREATRTCWVVRVNVRTGLTFWPT